MKTRIPVAKSCRQCTKTVADDGMYYFATLVLLPGIPALHKKQQIMKDVLHNESVSKFN